MKSNKLYWRIDSQIRAPEVRVIGDDGTQFGILKVPEAVAKAHELGLTLVEIAPNATPPVCKIVDYGKFRYREEKKIKAIERKSKPSELKEIRFSPFIAENDYQIRSSRVREFLEDKNKVRIVVAFRGSQMRSKQFGYDILKRIIRDYGDSIAVDMEPKFLGRNLMMIISPVSKRGEKVVKPEEIIKVEKIEEEIN